MSIKQHLLCLASLTALTACGTGPAPATSTASISSQGSQRQISGAAGDSFMEALLSAGISDLIGAIGATNLSVETVTCSSPVVPHPVPHCTIEWNGSEVTPSAADAQVLYSTLVAQGGVLIQPHVVGATNAQATRVQCSRPVYPGAQATCTFDVAAQTH